MWARCRVPSLVYLLPRTTAWWCCATHDSNDRSQVCSPCPSSSRKTSVYRMALFWEREVDLRSPLQSVQLILLSWQCNLSDILSPVSSWNACSFRFRQNRPFRSPRQKCILAKVHLKGQSSLLTNRFSVLAIKSWTSQWTLVSGFQLFRSLILAVCLVRRKFVPFALVSCCHSG